MIGQVLKVVDLADKGLIILRFGERYDHVPSLAIPRSVFEAWLGSRVVNNRPWISVTGVLQTHRTGKYSTVQVLVKEASDLELLPNEDEAQYRLGRITRPAPVPPPHQAASVAAPPGPANTSPGPPSSQSDRWKITRETARGAPGWMPGAGDPASGAIPQQAATASTSNSKPTARGACPSCGWDNNMPPGAIMLQCSRCGIVTVAERWPPSGPARASGAASSAPLRATVSTKSPATPASIPRGACPSCGWDDDMPLGAIMLQCSHCGIVTAAGRWRPSGSARASGAAPSTPINSTVSPKSPTTWAPRPTSTPPTQPNPRQTSASPSVARPTYTPGNPWQYKQPGGAPPGGGLPPNGKGLLSRLARRLFGRSGS
jgi:ribosomal protein L37AE/L43A